MYILIVVSAIKIFTVKLKSHATKNKEPQQNQHLQHIKLLTKMLYLWKRWVFKFVFVAKRCKCGEQQDQEYHVSYKIFL